jgi:hypothetical protein
LPEPFFDIPWAGLKVVIDYQTCVVETSSVMYANSTQPDYKLGQIDFFPAGAARVKLN